jgi:hypothetical protein
VLWLLRNKTSSNDRLGEEDKGQPGSSALEVAKGPSTEVVFRGLLTLRVIGSAMFEHMIEHPRQLMRSSGLALCSWAFFAEWENWPPSPV